MPLDAGLDGTNCHIVRRSVRRPTEGPSGKEWWCPQKVGATLSWQLIPSIVRESANNHESLEDFKLQEGTQPSRHVDCSLVAQWAREPVKLCLTSAPQDCVLMNIRCVKHLSLCTLLCSNSYLKQLPICEKVGLSVILSSGHVLQWSKFFFFSFSINTLIWILPANWLIRTFWEISLRYTKYSKIPR